MEEPGAFQRFLLRAFELPKANRDVFLLKDMQGYTLAECAEILKISVGTAQARLERARREIAAGANSAAVVSRNLS